MQDQSLGKLNIIVAVWGLNTVTDNINQLIKKGFPETLQFKVTNDVIGEDGWVGQIKSLTVVYNYDGGDVYIATAKEGDELLINPDNVTATSTANENYVNKDGLSVLAATYGLADVTDKVRQLVSPENILSFKVDNATFGDGWVGIAKTFVIILGLDSEAKAIEILVERENCHIDLNEAITAI